MSKLQGIDSGSAKRNTLDQTTQETESGARPSTETKTRVAKTRGVSIGPVARQLSSRRKQQHLLPKIALALATIGCGFVVHVAINNSALWPRIVDRDVTPPAPVVTSLSHVGDHGHTQVRTVIELVGAFESLENEQGNNPLSLPRISPTAPVGVYAAPQESATETEEFLGQINMSPRPEDEESEQGDSSEKPVLAMDVDATKAEANVVRPASYEPEIPALDTLQAVESRTTPAELEDIESLTADLLPAKSIPAKSLVTKSLPTESLAAIEMRSEEAANLSPGPDDITLADNSETMDFGFLPDVPETEPEEAGLHVEVMEALAAYEEALLAITSSSSDRAASRAYYAALAELGRVAYVHQSEECRQQISQVYANPKLYALTDSASASWIKWPKRQSEGVVVAGKVRTVTEAPNGFLVAVQTSDRKASVLYILVDKLNFELRTSERAIFAGIATEHSPGIAPGQSIATPIQAEFVAPVKVLTLTLTTD